MPLVQLRPLFEAVVHAAEPLIAATPSLFVEIGRAGKITSFCPR